uniref:C-type lectin domain-containing protein n=2 Tax=Myripristis murdjan TaxID=586833 RepID=A0A667XAA7_9TELE
MTDRCQLRLFFLCYNEPLVLVRENKTWEEALASCRALAADHDAEPDAFRNHRYDLASLLSDSDYAYARTQIQSATTDEVWMGLRFLAGGWLWVNGDGVQHDGLPPHPEARRRCGALAKSGDDSWTIRDCSERRNFLCLQRT